MEGEEAPKLHCDCRQVFVSEAGYERMTEEQRAEFQRRVETCPICGEPSGD